MEIWGRIGKKCLTSPDKIFPINPVITTMKRFAAILATFLVLSLLLFTSCRTKSAVASSLYADYAHALDDARRPNSRKVSHSLMPIREDEPGLDWITVDTTKMVLVCKMIDKRALGVWNHTDTFRLPKKKGYWVLLPADLKRRAKEFEGLDSVAARLRLVQMLGLWPTCEYDMMVEFYVEAKSVFRPAYDPRITTTTSPAEFPEWADDSYIVGDTRFREWFATQQQTSYEGVYACPWAQLGYTYDWHHGAPREGVAEYIAAHNALLRHKSSTGAWTFIQKILGK